MYDGFYFDNFFDLPEQALPQDCEYYFNVTVFEVAGPIGWLAERLGIKETQLVDDISHVKDPRPIYICFYEEEGLDKIEIEAFSHTVIEVNMHTREVCWYDMLDFETERPWAIEPIEEDFYDEEDEDNNEN